MTRQIQSLAEYQSEYEKSIQNTAKFWSEQAASFVWRKPWNSAFQSNFESAENKWFIGGKLNITEKCIYRHIQDRANQPALIWEPIEIDVNNVVLT